MTKKSGPTSVLVSALIVLTLLGPASALSVSVSQATASVTTTNWGVAPAATGSAPQTTPLLVAWVKQANNAFSYFDAVNTGGEMLQDFTLIMDSILGSGGSGNSQQSVTLTFQVCDGGSWNLDDHTCSGSITELISYEGANTVSILVSRPITVGQAIGFRVTTSWGGRNNLSTSLSFSASNSGIRAPLILGS